MEQRDNNFNAGRLAEIIRAIVILLFAIVIAYKMIVTPLSMTMDFYALLSLLLALFSVGLSALFYFKATDTSNAFYDNTYKFTKDIAELLVRIESGFGERLRHLDEGYTRMQDRFYPLTSKEEVAETQKQVEKEEENLNTKLKERERLIEELVQKSQLDTRQKEEFLEQIKKRDNELHRLQVELTKLREQADEQLAMNEDPTTLRHIRRYIATDIIPRIPRSSLSKSKSLNDAWGNIKESLSDRFLADFRHYGFIDREQNLTVNGIKLIRAVFSSRLNREIDKESG